jgi:hypothetical protein
VLAVRDALGRQRATPSLLHLLRTLSIPISERGEGNPVLTNTVIFTYPHRKACAANCLPWLGIPTLVKRSITRLAVPKWRFTVLAQGDVGSRQRATPSPSHIQLPGSISWPISEREEGNPISTHTVIVHQGSNQPSPAQVSHTDSPPSLRVGFATRTISFKTSPANRSWLRIPTLTTTV